jgi:hypothetical protein
MRVCALRAWKILADGRGPHRNIGPSQADSHYVAGTVERLWESLSLREHECLARLVTPGDWSRVPGTLRVAH